MTYMVGVKPKPQVTLQEQIIVAACYLAFFASVYLFGNQIINGLLCLLYDLILKP
jgi:hypothetical protein